MCSETKLKKQVEKVIDLVLEKKSLVNQEDHNYLNTLFKKFVGEFLNDNENIEKIKQQTFVKGALRAYFENFLVDSYQKPLVVER
ncbi:hypothetical protein BN2127_JRS7_00153 [Bacillus subtilis]|jgi:hypothetical protein|uniref:hypothetical protein n=1 Tax=Bacillus spizizenii TaxID=96241 RepID=UPI0006A87E67|nr:hypothetical protein [Bacillus spizizenii]MEC1528804.1 hypothetical protein [Bacillus spizizenii]OWV35500.1 hypothetical protein CE489_18360 [Bacillus spizizenii]CUB26863.1 hypothetical protein BN2127_JRS1_08568 [Bacillus cereus]CUB33662.1 hypothetical protein BN2127_JRS7_00153 [Bacillus subtilis]